MKPVLGTQLASCGGEDVLLVREEPLLIEVGEQTVLTMRTPGHDADLALGFLLTEGILQKASDVERFEVSTRDDEAMPVDVARAVLRSGFEPGPLARQRLSRAHTIHPSCGLCGLLSAEGLARHLQPLRPHAPQVSLERLALFASEMRRQQPIFEATGGSHAAAIFCAESGEAWAIREDIGRHNALDKALGRCAADGRDLTQAVAILSGRGGYELVLKALRLNVAVVASVSASSALAVSLAEEHGQTLIGFLRGTTGRVYTDDERVVSS